jgi:hypothetical protein
MAAMAGNFPKFDVFVVEETAKTDSGSPFKAKSDTLVIELQAHPIGSRLVLRPYRPPPKDGEAQE